MVYWGPALKWFKPFLEKIVCVNGEWSINGGALRPSRLSVRPLSKELILEKQINTGDLRKTW